MSSRMQRTTLTYLTAEIVTLGIVFLCLTGFVSVILEGNHHYTAAVPIDTSLSALPYYILLSLTRSLIALIISFIVAILVGTWAAKGGIANPGKSTARLRIA